MSSKPKIGHYVVIKGRGYWSPTPAMKAAGFKLISCGPDGPEAQAKAREAEESYQLWRQNGDEKPNPFPAGSFGSFWHRLHDTELWKRKAPATRVEYEYVWDKYVKGEFATKRIDHISPVECERFHTTMETKHGAGERFKAMKILRALFSAAVKYQVIAQSPATTLPNTPPKGRKEFWLVDEVEQLIKDAWKHDFHGMAVGIAIAWDTMMSPVDVRTLRNSEIKKDQDGSFIDRSRTKTRKELLAPVSPTTEALISTYRVMYRPYLVRTEHLLVMRHGGVYRTKDTFAKDFRRVRDVSFKGDTRRLMDIRRSGNIEAWVGGAERDTMGKALANRLGDNQFLFETYTPQTLVAARQISDARRLGREQLKPKEEDGQET